MPCLHPNLLYKFKRPEDDKWTTKFFSGVYADEVKWFSNLEHDRREKLKAGWQAEICIVGCGRCVKCRLQRSRENANRCALEASLYPKSKNFFLTLTYEDSSLIYSQKSGLPTTHLNHVSDFMKRLRRFQDYHFGEAGTRFYSCSEYGDQTARPHYHDLVFNANIEDLKLIAHNKFGNPLYTSQKIDDLWGHGLVCIGELNWNTAAYTARYVMKKQYGQNAIMYDEVGIDPPDTRMSRKPGIAVPWFEKFGSDLYKQIGVNEEGFPIFNDRIVLPSNGDQPLIFKPPRIFEKKADHSVVDVDQVKFMRRYVAELAEEQRRTQVMESDRQYFDALDDALTKSSQGLIRKFQNLC